jgi:hypothetical protein
LTAHALLHSAAPALQSGTPQFDDIASQPRAPLSDAQLAAARVSHQWLVSYVFVVVVAVGFCAISF